MYQKTAEEMLSFIQKNPTAFHAVATLKAILQENGYAELLESGKWNLEQGKNYFV